MPSATRTFFLSHDATDAAAAIMERLTGGHGVAGVAKKRDPSPGQLGDDLRVSEDKLVVSYTVGRGHLDDLAELRVEGPREQRLLDVCELISARGRPQPVVRRAHAGVVLHVKPVKVARLPVGRDLLQADKGPRAGSRRRDVAAVTQAELALHGCSRQSDVANDGGRGHNVEYIVIRALQQMLSY